MEKLNQFAISHALGSTMKFVKRPGFGPLGAMHLRNQVLTQCPRSGEQTTFSPSAEKLIARSFEETREGLPVDRVLADPAHAARFIKRCRSHEVMAADHAIALRLLGLRKSPRKHVRIKKATVKEPRRSFIDFAFAAEIAMSQIKYRYGASVDDILAYPDIGKEFDRLAAGLYPGLTPLDYRLAALHVRKSRFCEASERDLFDTIKTSSVERNAKDYGALEILDLDKVDGVEGIMSIVEQTSQNRELYITQTTNAKQAVLPFTKKRTFAAMASSFWSPSLATIRLVVYDIHQQLRIAPGSLWTKKLISVKGPIFNYSVAA